ncbi:MAG: helix-turn-helix transcriptional regulator, partial [Alcanivoracaceae bacterium]|nr:helix-turn-helix transcriptional regulator [Alcanivoracaceae bacterium]
HDSGDPYRRVLIRLLRDGDASLQKLAEAFNISARTLQRKLADEGLRYQQLLDDTRRMQAQEYLRDTRLALADIAGLLGYSEQSAFNRAFRQWIGMTPAKWRQQQR